MTASRRPWNRDPCFDGPPERGKTRPLSLANGEQLAQFLARPLVHSRSDTHRSNIYSDNCRVLLCRAARSLIHIRKGCTPPNSQQL